MNNALLGDTPHVKVMGADAAGALPEPAGPDAAGASGDKGSLGSARQRPGGGLCSRLRL